jgi:hypothetical protein
MVAEEGELYLARAALLTRDKVIEDSNRSLTILSTTPAFRAPSYF